MKILIMGLPGSGKTHLAKRLQIHLNCAWYNADKVREMANDWDFTDAGRRRQSERMNTIATFEAVRGRTVICDFVCPTGETRKQFDADITMAILNILAYIMVGLMLLSVLTAVASDLKERYEEKV